MNTLLDICRQGRVTIALIIAVAAAVVVASIRVSGGDDVVLRVSNDVACLFPCL